MSKALSEARRTTTDPALAAMSTDELRSELAKGLSHTADSLARVAAIVRELEERGEDLSDLRIGLLPYLRQIAYGQILPGVVVRYSQSPALIRAIGSLPLPDQEAMAAGEPVKVAVRSGDTVTHRLVDPMALPRDQFALVFAPGRIRDLAEQAAILDSRDKSHPRQSVRSVGRIKVDRKSGTLAVGRSRFTPAELVAAISELHSSPEFDEGPDDQKAIVVKLTEEEHKALKVRAAEAGVSMQGLARRAFRAAGLI